MVSQKLDEARQPHDAQSYIEFKLNAQIGHRFSNRNLALAVMDKIATRHHEPPEMLARLGEEPYTQKQIVLIAAVLGLRSEDEFKNLNDHARQEYNQKHGAGSYDKGHAIHSIPAAITQRVETAIRQATSEQTQRKGEMEVIDAASAQPYRLSQRRLPKRFADSVPPPKAKPGIQAESPSPIQAEIEKARVLYEQMAAYDEAQAKEIGKNLLMALIELSGMKEQKNLPVKLSKLTHNKISYKSFDKLLKETLVFRPSTFAADGAIDDLMIHLVPDNKPFAQEAANYIVGVPWPGRMSGLALVQAASRYQLDGGQMLKMHRTQERKSYDEYAAWLGIKEWDLSRLSGYQEGSAPKEMIDKVAFQLGCTDEREQMFFRRIILGTSMATQKTLDAIFEIKGGTGADPQARGNERVIALRNFFHMLQEARDLRKKNSRRAMAAAIAGGGDATTQQVYDAINNMIGTEKTIQEEQAQRTTSSGPNFTEGVESRRAAKKRYSKTTSEPIAALVAKYAYPDASKTHAELRKQCIAFLSSEDYRDRKVTPHSKLPRKKKHPNEPGEKRR